MASSDTPPGRAALAGGGQPQKEGGSDPPSRRRRSDSAAGREKSAKKKFNSGAKPPRKGAPDQRVTSEVRSLPSCPQAAEWQGNVGGMAGESQRNRADRHFRCKSGAGYAAILAPRWRDPTRPRS